MASMSSSRQIARMRVLIKPFSTMAVTSMDFWSVTRRPLTMRVSMPSDACKLSSCGPPPWTSTVLMPTWCRIATCSINVRVDISSLKTAPPALMTNTLFLYMRMYGAALLSACTAMEGSGRLIIIVIPQTVRSSQHAMQNGHLYRQTIEGLALDHRARAVQNFIGDRDVAAHRQAVHELGVGQRARKPALAHAPIGEIGTQPRVRLRVAVVHGRAPLLGVQHAR